MSNFDETLMKRLTKLEREVERLKVKESPIMSNYLLTTGKAADSDKLDGIDSTGFATAGHDHNAAYLGITAKAADSDKLDGLDSTDFGRPVFLTTALTSTAWDGDSFSTTAKTLIDMSTEFGVPAGVKAVRLKIAIRDSGSASSTPRFQLSGIPTGDSYSFSLIASEINDRLVYAAPVVPCDNNGDLYYEITASGAGTMDVYMTVWGYWL